MATPDTTSGSGLAPDLSVRDAIAEWGALLSALSYQAHLKDEIATQAGLEAGTIRRYEKTLNLGMTEEYADERFIGLCEEVFGATPVKISTVPEELRNAFARGLRNGRANHIATIDSTYVLSDECFRLDIPVPDGTSRIALMRPNEHGTFAGDIFAQIRPDGEWFAFGGNYDLYFGDIVHNVTRQTSDLDQEIFMQ